MFACIQEARRATRHICVLAIGSVALMMVGAPARAAEVKPVATPSLVQPVQYGDRERDRGERDRSGGGEERYRRFGFEDRFSDEGEWELLGKQKVGLLGDRDVIRVGRREGRYDRLVFAVRGNAIDLLSARVVYGNGETEEVAYRDRIPEGGRTRPIEIRGREGRFIQEIQLVYRSQLNLRGDATFFVYGRNAGGGRREVTDGKKANCETYAGLAVIQAQANEKYNCRIRGYEWSDNKRGHYEWCLRQKRDWMIDEIRFRQQELQKCFDKLGDYDDEGYDRGYRRRF